MLKKEDYFKRIDSSEQNSEFIAMEAKSFARDVWERFRTNKRALAGLIVLGAVILIAAIGPVISPYPYDGMDTAIRNQGSSLPHPMGTEQCGWDLLPRVMYGTRISLMIGFVSTLINLVIGVIYGGIAGYVGGRPDMWMMRVVDVIYAIPNLLYIILIMLLFGANVGSIMLGICISGWVGLARIVRTQIISLKEQEFSLAAFVLGAGPFRILFKHLMINSLGPIIVTVTLMIPQAIFMEAFLSFIGIGISAPMASLGTLAQDAKTYLEVYPMQMLYPVLVISIIIFALNFIGEGLSAALNPKGRR